MKYTARLVAVVLAMTLSLSAFAAGQFKDIQRAMMDSKWGQAEEMLQTYLAQNPNNAKGHYLLATTYEQTRRYAEANVELNKANRIDANQKFASPGQADAMANRLSMKLAMNNPKPRSEVATREPVRERPHPRESTYSQPRQASPVVAVAPTATPQSSHQNTGSGGGFLTFLLVVFALVITGGGLYYWVTSREQKRVATAMDDARKAMLATVVSMQERLQVIRDKLKYQNKLNSSLGNSLDGIASNLNAASSILRDRSQNENNALDRQRRNLDNLENQLSQAEGRLGRKEFDTPTRTAPTPPAPQQYTTNRPPPPPVPRPPAPPTPPAPPVQVVHHYHETQSRDSGPDLLTTMVLADALSSSHRDDERRRERERDAELAAERRDREFEANMERKRQQQRDDDDRRDRERQERDEQDRRSSYTPPAMDFGGRDDSDSSRNDSPSMDFGGKDD